MPNYSVSPARLDPEQKTFLEKELPTGKNYWICGFPGSGKSTLLEHCIRIIKADKPKASILVIVFTRSLIEMFKAAFDEMGLEHVTIKTMYEFVFKPERYDFILCDEVQDLTPRIFDAMRKYSSHLIVAGDENQSIYETDPQFNEKTINPNVISTSISGNPYPLTIVHRLSPAIQQSIQYLIPSLTNLANLTNMADHQTQIRLCRADSWSQEVEYIWKEAQKAPRIRKTSAILFSTHNAVMQFVSKVTSIENKVQWKPAAGTGLNDMNEYLKNQGVKLQYVGNDYGNLKDTDCVILMTYHSAKGLDFDNVYLPDIDSNLYISRTEELSRKIFMVAMTRSRNNLYLCYSGTPHPYLECVSSNRKNYVSVDISKVLAPVETGPIGF